MTAAPLFTDGSNMKTPSLTTWMALLMATLGLAACQSLSSHHKTVPVTRSSAAGNGDSQNRAVAVERPFAEGLDFYYKGNYLAAIEKFKSPELASAPPPSRVRTLKYLAFSYCVTNQLPACQQAFYDALRIDPQFKLSPSEAGHPIWGPVFLKARSGPPEKSRSAR